MKCLAATSDGYSYGLAQLIEYEIRYRIAAAELRAQSTSGHTTIMRPIDSLYRVRPRNLSLAWRPIGDPNFLICCRSCRVMAGKIEILPPRLTVR
jgi:hypothetical protein